MTNPLIDLVRARPGMVLLFAAGCGVGANRDPAPDPRDQESTHGRLSLLLDTVRTELGAPGAVLGIHRDDGPTVVVASGVADRESGQPMTPDQPYFLGSISKTYTAVAIIRLAEDGRLSLDDKIRRFIPSFPDGDRISIRELLQHTSGLKDFYTYLYYRPDRAEMVRFVTKRWTEAELLALSARFGRWFEPGTNWSYSSTNYYLLGVIVERASGLSLPEAYRQYIYQPLGIDSTWLAMHEPARGSPAKGYMGRVEGWKHSAMFGELGATAILDSSSVEWGAGGLVAPANDALRFLSGLFTSLLRSPASLPAMTTFRAAPNLGVTDSTDATGEPDGYGLGLVRMKRAGFTVIGHGGLFTGHTAGVWFLPECRLTIALYFNRGFVNQRGALDRILPILTRDPTISSRCQQGR